MVSLETDTLYSLSAWSPWKAQDAVQLLAETARADIQFPSDAFRGVSMAGE